ncbi:O-sialoglycoprotein endopeptidase, partial [Effusibacillus lacus]
MILGIDTSNYTTSLCLIDGEGHIVNEQRKPLAVETGKQGLQQSTALFQHVKNLPELFEKMGELRQLEAICVSVRPRPVEGSYMPVFLAGESVARTLASSFHIPLYRTSHQEGHIAAGEATAGRAPADEFLAVHLSGGTSDLLLARRRETGYEITRLGSSRDLHAGQFIDRVGVALGLPFPAGPHLEKLASTASEDAQGIRLPSPVEGFNWSFSGPETAARKWIDSGADPAGIARAVEDCIAKGLEKVLLKAMQQTQLRSVLIVGGVAANLHIRRRLLHRLQHPAVGADLFFADPSYSTDNAYGVARIG